MPLSRALLLLAVIAAASPAAARYDIGRPATRDEIAGWDIDILPDESGLPLGRGSVKEGEKVYAETCASCQEAKGEGKPVDRLVGGQGTLATATPIKTVGGYWPCATTLFDYIRRAMPFGAPQSLAVDQVYAVSAYILFLNGVVGENAMMDAAMLPKVAMPNRNGFLTPDPRADTGEKRCEKNCR
jgi:hypothetical protein